MLSRNLRLTSVFTEGLLSAPMTVRLTEEGPKRNT